MTVETIAVGLGERAYDILVGEGLLAEAGALLAPVLARPRVVVVSDATVAGLHLPALSRALTAAGIEIAGEVVLPPGEATKDFAHLERLVDGLLAARVERRTTVVALGGGVIGDIAGFAAAITLRGLPVVQIPTTLLSQVDSAVGGKTAIDTPRGKNLVGAFHQPRRVLCDVGLLATLPRRERLAGYAEVVKYGLIDRPAFYDWLEGAGPRLIDGDAATARRAVAESCRAKAEIVARDEQETGDRALLNLGHTFGHALELAVGFGDRLRHGEAVAIGMVIAFDLSVRLGLCPGQDALRLRRHLQAVGLPVSPAGLVPGLAPERLIDLMAADKKVSDGRLTFILARGIGQAFISRDVEPTALRQQLALALAP
ncbi:MAG: 3-dehydroquinate synthase [Thalassobaculales bacterium]